LKLLIPYRRSMAASMASVIILATSERLAPHLYSAVRVRLPGETPYWQVSGLQKGDLKIIAHQMRCS